jgi:Zn-dependent protease
MLPSWKLGRVAGIDVFVHPSFLLVLLLPGVWEIGLLTMVAVFGCVLLHELGHALMARRFGINTQDITLYPIGGVARLERMPRAPGAELLIALAGPAVNFAIVAALVVLGVLGLDGGGFSPELGLFVDQMLLINLGLGLFNLIPAFPMDGGRILRALLSGLTGRATATMIAATIGRTLAIVFGVVSLLVTHNLVHVALAAFIFLAARAEEAQVLSEERRRRYDGVDQGVWVAPPGYRWIQQSNGVWQLAPVVVTIPRPERGPSPWV